MGEKESAARSLQSSEPAAPGQPGTAEKSTPWKEHSFQEASEAAATPGAQAQPGKSPAR